MSYSLTFLGTGSSGGVPRIGHHWGNADRTNPKNRRRRSAVIVERQGPHGKTTVLVDTPPDLRDQCLERDVLHVDGVLFTHDHADHTHGIDDLRAFAINERRRIDVYMDAATWDSLLVRFRYCFEQKPNSGYMPILNRHAIAAGHPVTIEGKGGPITALPILQDHGEMPSLGFRFGRMVYSPDIVGIPEASEAAFRGLDMWIVDALRPMPHPSHWSVKQALAQIEKFAPKQALLTHMHVDLDYDELERKLPAHVRPAYDGLKIEFEGDPACM
jgi:phosphoribosyl 1,2-cyclic phosphate phosphodiesterase